MDSGESVGEEGPDMLDVTERLLVRTGVLVGYAEGGTLLFREVDRSGEEGRVGSSSRSGPKETYSDRVDDFLGCSVFPMVDWLSLR